MYKCVGLLDFLLFKIGNDVFVVENVCNKTCPCFEL